MNKPKKFERVRTFLGGGLYMETSKAGTTLWRFKYRFHNVEKRLALGASPFIDESRARELALVAKKTLAGGVDPGAVKSYVNEMRRNNLNKPKLKESCMTPEIEAKTEAQFGMVCAGDLMRELLYPKNISQIDFLRQFNVRPAFSKRCAGGFREFIAPEDAQAIRGFLNEKSKTTDDLKTVKTPDGVAFTAILNELAQLKTMVEALTRVWK